MQNECIQFEFLGFDPKQEVKSFITTVGEKLHLGSPSDSVMRLVLKKSKDIIQASCKIASCSGPFVADAVSENPIIAIQEIEKKINQQLEVWRKRRFNNLD